MNRSVLLWKCITWALGVMASSGAIAQQNLPSSTSTDSKTPWTTAISAGVWDSRWREDLGGSSHHVDERGTLALRAITLAHNSDWGIARLQIQTSGGSRGYDGWTSTGAAIASTSDIDLHDVQAEYQWKLSPDFSWGFRIEREVMSRRIQGVSGVQGYLENYENSSLLVGVTKTFHLSGDNMLDVSAWYGGGEGPRMTLNLTPYDPATVKLGHMRQMEFSAAWKTPMSIGGQSTWHLVSQLTFSRCQTGQSSSASLQQNGLSKANFIQPSTARSNWIAIVGVQYGW